jgi:hypothetical protein
MRVLQAFFHPASRSRPGPSIAIAHVYCEGGRASVQPVQSAFEHSAPVEKLRFLVAEAGADPYQALLSLRSEYWSFGAVG